MSLQPNEVLIIALVALIVLGPKRLPGAIRGIGRAFRQVRDFSASVRQEMDATLSAPIIEPADPPAKPRSPEGAEPAAEPAATAEMWAIGPAADEPRAADALRAAPSESAADPAEERPTSDGSA
ncbi:Sec-independent protein translocase subunit TatA/TatB [Candidatus Poriferisodalis sp.]|uniref:Sec-independent protein translocase subunit TatA/TatB n=1 Tax=Candidatus Poriferisodalis sp. TaxID=3101277 RepID=UPI003B0152C8